MKRTAALYAALLAAMSLPAVAAPTPLNKVQLDQVVAGAITATQVNGGGQTPQGVANGVPTVNLNPAGHPPPGQN